jgi:PAS domain S-box-containing protein
MRKSTDGEILDHQAVVRDITERKKAREMASQLASIVEYSDDAIISTTLDGLIRTWNRGAERIYGYSADEIRGCSIAILGDRDLDGETAKILEQIKSGGRIEHFETKHKTKGGREICVSLTLSPVRDVTGMITGTSAITRDITEHKFMASQIAQTQRLESIGQLAAGIAHEINTPTQYIGDNTRFIKDAYGDLHRILGKYEELLKAVRDGKPTDEVVREVEAECVRAEIAYLFEEVPKAIHETLEGVGRVAKIVGAMKEFSHPGAAEKVATDINKAIESTLTVARNEWKYVADMVTGFDPSLSLVPCLRGEFNQVILNMIINAVHAVADVVGDGSKGKGTITVTTRRVEKWAEICIGDTGTGIREEIRSRIFDPFFTTKEVGKGTGQGLAIARSVIVDKHDGTIDFETEMGKGTTFIIRLPMETEPGSDRWRE